MHTAPTLILSLLIALACAHAVYWAVVLRHVLRTRAAFPDGDDGLALARDPDIGFPPLVVVVPAHNEQDNIETVARSLVAQDYPDLRVVFALDRCTDGTRARLERALADDTRCTIVEIAECPQDWSGKTHALWRGYRSIPDGAEPALVAFLDADTSLHPRGLRGAVALLETMRLPDAENPGIDVLSLLSTLSSSTWFERAIQPAASFELVRQYPLARVNRVHGRRAFANGQFILMRRETYAGLGGHEAVRDAVLEDMELARLAERSGVRAGVCLAGGLLRCRMYDDLSAFRRGWKRIYTECANRKPGRLRKLARRARFVGTALPAGSALAVIAPVVLGFERAWPLSLVSLIAGCVALLVWMAGVGMCLVLARTPVWHAVFYPLGTWVTGSILREAARDLERGTPTSWAGMSYVRQAR